MNINKSNLASLGSTSLFVLIWSSGAFFSKLGLQHASIFTFLILRFALAFVLLLGLGLWRGQWRPDPGTRGRVALAGLLMLGGYASFFLLALDHGLTPGVLATVLGVQPILTLLVQERRFSGQRLAGLVLSLTGLTVVVWHSLIVARFSLTGLACALAALGCMTVGAILQKQVKQSPWQVLPWQYGCSLILCVVIGVFQPWHVDFQPGFLVAWLWLGLVISVLAQLLFYRLIQRGNLVNVTSLFYLVPVMTAVLDYLLLGNSLSVQTFLGMSGILLGLMLVFRPVKMSSAGN
ncbi:MAG TPA: DMT family transporter [Verrucomicrobium sp.]|nr:DMT family transporter [Verrucomicrobium sp.]